MTRRALVSIAALAVTLAACADSDPSIMATAGEAAQPASDQANDAAHANHAADVHAGHAGESMQLAQADASANAGLPQLVVYKSPTCGCCGNWVEHMRKAGFPVEVKDVDNLNPIKTEVGIPPGKGSCHTARVGDYFVEGHVPAEDVMRLLKEKPNAKGLTVPGMPIGSPGMEVPSGEVTPYDVLLVAQDGSTSVFAHHAKP